MKLPNELYTHEARSDGTTVCITNMRQQVLHCIGMVDSGSSRHKPYKRHGKIFYRPWRNYFCAPYPNKTWDALCDIGYADHGTVGEHGTTYWVTRKGLDWVGEQLGMTIYDEER
ncbi:MAG: hypothetical protein RR743_01025 [Oscillospiraceae bacterium]